MDHKFLIILCAYDRPRMMQNFLRSVRDQDYDNWFFYFIDDGSSDENLFSIVKNILGEKLGNLEEQISNEQHKFYYEIFSKGILARINDTPEDKRNQNGSRHPEQMNYAIMFAPEFTDEDIVIIGCDDDALYPGYLKNLNEYYKARPEVNYSYCHLAPYEPHIEKPDPEQGKRNFWLNHGVDVPAAWCKVDSTQVTYRKKIFTQYGVRYPSPAFRALDAACFSQLDKLGPTRFNGIIGQYKASFPNQLSYRISEEDIYNPIDIDDEVWKNVYNNGNL